MTNNKHTRPYAQVIVKEKAKKRLQSGHPWVYDNEIIEFRKPYTNGDIVDVFSEKDTYIGAGFINDQSKITVRILSRNMNDQFDDAFYERRLRHAWEYRKSVMGDDIDNCRIIFGEADSFPGLTIDRFSDILVVQTLSLGMEQRKDRVLSLLFDILKEDGVLIRGIYERNDVAIRKLEGLEETKGWYVCDALATHPESPIVDISENGIVYHVDVENGQKTGFFLDQKYNRQAVARLAKGKTVLDCFTHTGSFGLNAAKGGAAHVHSVDISESAIAMAQEHARINGLDSVMSFETADVLEMLDEMKGKPYDFIILDPPAFTKSRTTIAPAMRGYQRINQRAMKLLPRGGYLATCSCSHFMSESLFKKMLHDAAEQAGVGLRQIEFRQQSADHPILWNVDETYYLKFFLFQIV